MRLLSWGASPRKRFAGAKSWVSLARMRFLVLFVAALASAQIVPPPGSSLLHADIGRDHGFTELVTNIAPGYAAGLQINDFSGGMGEPDVTSTVAVLSHLVWRRNTPDSQANFYLSAGLGVNKIEAAETEPGVSTAFQVDWETRRLHAAFIGHLVFGEATAQGEFKIHLGFAPWVAPYEKVAPWLLLEISRVVGREGDVEVAPMLVLMYQAYRLEAGANTDGHPRVALRWLF